ncbi:MAG: hypothetical protein CM1200mP4_1670 [Rhodospirillaceae bacterium]|nr:MAG: hypothetical protein CM1200mP4_1670 [Rhodospirillaceae bacterium]
MWVGMLQKVLRVIPFYIRICWNSVVAEEPQRETLQVTVVAGLWWQFLCHEAACLIFFQKKIEGPTYSIVPVGRYLIQ